MENEEVHKIAHTKKKTVCSVLVQRPFWAITSLKMGFIILSSNFPYKEKQERQPKCFYLKKIYNGTVPYATVIEC